MKVQYLQKKFSFSHSRKRFHAIYWFCVYLLCGLVVELSGKSVCEENIIHEYNYSKIMQLMRIFL